MKRERWNGFAGWGGEPERERADESGADKRMRCDSSSKHCLCTLAASRSLRRRARHLPRSGCFPGFSRQSANGLSCSTPAWCSLRLASEDSGSRLTGDGLDVRLEESVNLVTVLRKVASPRSTGLSGPQRCLSRR